MAALDQATALATAWNSVPQLRCAAFNQSLCTVNGKKITRRSLFAVCTTIEVCVCVNICIFKLWGIEPRTHQGKQACSGLGMQTPRDETIDLIPGIRNGDAVQSLRATPYRTEWFPVCKQCTWLVDNWLLLGLLTIV